MKKLGLIALIASVILVSVATAQFWPIYWLLGSVNSATDGTSPDGQYVYIYKSDDERNAGHYSVGLIGTGGAAGEANKYMGNMISLGVAGLEVGQTYYAAMPNTNPADPASGYGALPVSFTVSGSGYDTAPALTYALGADPFPPPPPIGQEAGPDIKVWFGNRLYQPDIYKGDRKFIVSPTPNIEAKISIVEPYAVSKDVSDYGIELDPDTADAKDLSLSSSAMSAKASVDGDLKSFSLSYSLMERYKLADGTHVFRITAKSSGALGLQTTSTLLATVEVMGGPVRLIGLPLTWPSPYSIKAHGTVYIQYELSTDAPIEIYLVGASGQRIKRFNFAAGTEGGSAGINKITWDGKTDQGMLAGNAIYVGTIIAKEEGRLLGKVKLTIVD